MTKPTMPEFVAHVEQTLATQMEWARNEFLLPDLDCKLQIWDKESGSLGHLRTNFKAKKFTGYTLKVQSYNFLREEVRATAEYASYRWMPEVGMFETTDWKLAADTLIAHEMAHLVQMSLKRIGSNHPLWCPYDNPGDSDSMFFEGLGLFESSHGKFFRNIYRRLRKQFINHRVEGRIGIHQRINTFTHTDNFEEKLAAMPETPLKGLTASFKYQYVVVGCNPNERQKLYRYQVRSPQGKFCKVSLFQLVQASPHIKEVVMANPELAAELLENIAALRVKKVANAKSSMTKKIRSGVARVTQKAA